MTSELSSSHETKSVESMPLTVGMFVVDTAEKVVRVVVGERHEYFVVVVLGYSKRRL